MKELICEHCNKTFKAEKVLDFDEARRCDAVPCGQHWSITYYKEGVTHYIESRDHEPNEGYINACYVCRPHYTY